jgi:hypothetical protein
MLMAGGDMASAGSRFRGPPRGAVAARWRGGFENLVLPWVLAAIRGRGDGRPGMHKIWLGVVVLAIEAVVLVWLVGGHALQWFGSGLADR